MNTMEDTILTLQMSLQLISPHIQKPFIHMRTTVLFTATSQIFNVSGQPLRICILGG